MTLAPNEPRYQIDASDFRCRACEAEVPCETVYYSAVHFGGEAFERRNYCATCWAARDASEPGGGAFAFWRTRRPPLPADGPRKVRFDAAVIHQFFIRLGEGLPGPAGASPAAAAPAVEAPLPAAEAKEREDLRFVLALLLIRKKVLEFSSSREEEGVEWLRLETRVPKTRRPTAAEPAEEVEAAAQEPQPGPPAPAVHWVKSPRLSDAELERVKLKIGELLQLEL